VGSKRWTSFPPLCHQPKGIFFLALGGVDPGKFSLDFADLLETFKKNARTVKRVV
jgi:hypothetical protein